LIGISLKPEHLKRYRDIAWLFIKYGRSDLVNQSGLQAAIGQETQPAKEAAAKAEELASDLEKMGPTFIKLGQLLSTRADLLPAAYLESLARLQDQIEAFPFEDVERVVSSELEVKLSRAFETFDPVPVAAASLGQVHRAVLRDGSQVVVKVQRPGVREEIVEDLDALEEIASFLDIHTEMGKRYEFENMLRDLRKSLLRELDYRLEANNLARFRKNLRQFDLIVIPAPIEDYTTSRVLTMEYIRGKKITSLSPLALIELDGSRLAEQLFHAYLQQMLVDGVFHADPHPGNVFLTGDCRIALLDLGMVGRITSGFQEKLLRLLLAISQGEGEEAAEISIKMGEPKAGFDRTEFSRRISDLVAWHQDTTLDRIDAGHVVLEITRISADCWFRLPSEFTLIAKTMLNLDQVVHALNPSFDPNAVIRARAIEILEQHVVNSFRTENVLHEVLEVKDFVGQLPKRLNTILDAIGKNSLKIEVDAVDEKVLLDGLQKIANRITIGVVLAALILGAALLMRVESSFKILGYPGFPTLFFILAAGGAIWLIVSILLYDEKPSNPDSD
jgi:ubiquinone biosynthesis protein